MGLGDKRREQRQGAELAAWQAQRDRVQAFITRAQTFAGATNNEVPSLPLQLAEEEHALLVLPGVHLVEPRRLPGHFMGGNSGFTFHVARTARDHAVATDEDPTPIDTGVVTVTDKRTVFSGSLHTRTWEYATVIGFHTNADPPWTAIAVSDRQRVSGIRYDTTHAEEFRFALALGLARAHKAEDSLVDDLRRQLDELDRERPAALVVPETRVAPTGTAPVAGTVTDGAGVPTTPPFGSPAFGSPAFGSAPTPAPASSAPGSPAVAYPAVGSSAPPVPTPTPAASPVTPAAASTAAASTAPPPGWYPDPYRTARLRWWDGRAWTGHAAP